MTQTNPSFAAAEPDGAWTDLFTGRNLAVVTVMAGGVLLYAMAERRPAGGLGYAVIRTALPAALWARATGLISAMWGLGTLFGPSLGGLFAQFGLWRWAFGLLALAACLMILPARSGFRGTDRMVQGGSLPVSSLVTLTAAVVAISVSEVLPVGWPTLAALGVGGPLLAGLLGAVLSLAWVLAQLYTVTLTTPAARARAIRLGPLLLVLGLFAYGLMQQQGAAPWLVALQALFLAIAGAGIGLCWPLLGVAAMSSSADPAEGGKAAAAITTTQLIAFSITSALADVLMAAGQGGPQGAATWVSLGIAMLCLPGIWFGLRAAKG